ncbi:flagellin [Bradyrhizobium sp. 31Argb]|uniref:flagellin N-terminal helical domain-containing protein n=1 Tax=Bradyrhizobium sp. 31Argb TaxID=3141247 RepID=UPI00374A000D
MSGIVLSSSVRQNLLSLQSTADLLATTQSRLSTGKKVNSALDNPTNFFTAAALDNRASDINNLLDGIGNGVQVLQAASTGITSLQKLVDGAKSVATQALQSTVGYSAKSSVSVQINGATASNLLGTGAAIDTTVQGTLAVNNNLTSYSANSADGTRVNATHQTAYTNSLATLGTQINAASDATSVLSTAAGGALTAGAAFSVNGKTITFQATGAAAVDGSGNYTIGVDQTLGDLLGAIDAITGNTGTGGAVASSISGGAIQLSTGLAHDIDIEDGTGGAAGTLAKLGLSATAQDVTRTSTTNTTTPITAVTKLSGPQVAGGADALVGAGAAFTNSDVLVINGKTIAFNNGGGTSGSVANNDLSIDVSTGTIGDILTAINGASGATASIGTGADVGKIHILTSATQDVDFSGSNAATLAKLGLSGLTDNKVSRTPTAGAVQITGATKLSGTAAALSDAITTGFQTGDTITVNGKTITFVDNGAADNNHINKDDSIDTLLHKIDALTGAAPNSSSVSGGQITLHTGTTSDLTITSSNTAAMAALGFAGPISKTRDHGPSPLDGQTLSIGSTGGGTATSITFGGTGPGHVTSLNDLNAELKSNNLQATLAQDGTLTITTANDAASATIGLISGTAAVSGQLFFNKTPSDPVVDASASAARDALVTQYNNILNQITTTAQDASFNGVNLLTGDTLRLTFNETGKSTLAISGVNFNSAGLGLAALSSGDFKDNDSVQKVVSGLTNASSTLRAQASSFGSNLSIVQIRQDFSKNLINVLQTGSSNLTLADTNEEAANSQALSTRQSIAVSALALANQSQQSVLQLLR